ncbi:MAG: hypothetical protein ACRD0A_11350 [Acidimicrobiales bacterium]
MPEDVSSARPARLVRFADAAAAIDEGLRTRIGRLDEALAAYRATCESDYRLVPTTDTSEVVRAWAGRVAELGGWVGAVGEAFIAASGAGESEAEELVTLSDADIVGRLPDQYRDDPFLGVPVGGWQLDDHDVRADDPDAFADFLAELGLDATIADAVLAGFNDLLANTPTSATVTVTVTEGFLIFTADGQVVAQITRAEATARILLPGQVPSDLVTASRWLGRVGGALDFAGGAYSQWVSDAGLPVPKRILRAATEGGGALGGGILGGMGGGAAAGATAGLVCGPGAPVCSTVLAVGGTIVGAIGGSWLGQELVDLLPWMDDPPPPPPGAHDLDALRDEIAQDDGDLSDEFAPLDAATSLVAHDLALAETADEPDVQAELPALLPDREELLRTAEGRPDPDEITATGTTTTTVVAEPAPAPTPTPED